jgi:hypothetical protein
MNLGDVALAVLASGVAGTLADGFFFGFLWHEHYRAHPEVWWRPHGGSGETRAIVLSASISLLTSLALVPAIAALEPSGAGDVFLVAGAIFLGVPLPLLVTQALFVKLHPLVVVAHLLGWLARLLLVAAAVCVFVL